MKFALLAIIASFAVQTTTFSPEDLLNLQRPLTSAEVDAVVSSVRQAVAGKTLRLVQQGSSEDREVLVGPAGMPLMIRRTLIGGTVERIATVTYDGAAGPVPLPAAPERIVSLIEYSGVAARRCNGIPATAELVIQYVLNSATRVWTAAGRERRSADIAMAAPLEMLRATASMTSGRTRLIGDRTARAIVSPWPLPSDPSRDRVILTGDPAPNPAEFEPLQTLWIDTGSRLPLRWDILQRDATVRAFDFVYEPLEFKRPDGVEIPTCIP